MNFPIVLVIELCCLFLAVFYLKKKTAGYWHYFSWYILFITVIDGTGWALIELFSQQSNYWLYNCSMIVDIGFLSWMFYRIFGQLGFNSKPWILSGVSLVAISFVIESCYYKFKGQHDWLTSFNHITLSIFAVMLSAAAGYFYYLLLKKEEYIELIKHADFWFVTGIFFFYFVGTAIHLFFPNLSQINIINNIHLHYFISILLNLLLYGSWSIAFRCRYHQTISSY